MRHTDVIVCIVLAVICYMAMANVAFGYGRDLYKWSKGPCLVAAIFGPIAGLLMGIDVYLHTSLTGQYTWDPDRNPGPDKDVNVVPSENTNEFRSTKTKPEVDQE